MSQSSESVTNSVAEFVLECFAGFYEIYDVSLKPANKGLTLEVIIDHPDGIKVKDCEDVSRAVEKFLDDNELIHRAYTLEVSSPGIERVLKRAVDFERYVGKLVKWVLRDCDGEPGRAFQGRLIKFSESKIVVQTEKEMVELPPEAVKEAKAVFEFPANPKKEKRGGVK